MQSRYDDPPPRLRDGAGDATALARNSASATIRQFRLKSRSEQRRSCDVRREIDASSSKPHRLFLVRSFCFLRTRLLGVSLARVQCGHERVIRRVRRRGGGRGGIESEGHFVGFDLGALGWLAMDVLVGWVSGVRDCVTAKRVVRRRKPSEKSTKSSCAMPKIHSRLDALSSPSFLRSLAGIRTGRKLMQFGSIQLP